jgi:uncharacterized protein with HEPN domain
MSKRDRILLLEDMYDAVLKVKRYTCGMNYESFINDEKTIDAVVRNFEIIGEAANRIDEDFKLKNTELSWNHLRGFRNRIIHEYFGIDYEIVWSIIEEDIDNYIEWIDILIKQEKGK